MVILVSFRERCRFSKRSASPPDPLSRRVAGNRLELSFGLVRPCELGAFSCFGVEVTAADRAAATIAAWENEKRQARMVAFGLASFIAAQSEMPKGSLCRGSCHVRQRMAEDKPFKLVFLPSVFSMLEHPHPHFLPQKKRPIRSPCEG